MKFARDTDKVVLLKLVVPLNTIPRPEAVHVGVPKIFSVFGVRLLSLHAVTGLVPSIVLVSAASNHNVRPGTERGEKDCRYDTAGDNDNDTAGDNARFVIETVGFILLPVRKNIRRGYVV